MNILDKQISPSFHLYEFLQSPTAERYGLHDEQFNPPDEVVANIEMLVIHILQPIRDQLRGAININSGYRCPSVNTLVKGQKASYHITGMAADCTYKIDGKIDNLKLKEAVIASGIDFDQLISEWGTESNPAWIHVSYNPFGKNRKQILRIK